MPHYEAKASSKGQITIPVEVRAYLQLKEGDLVDFYVDPSTHRVRILARNAKASDLRGILAEPSQRPLSLEEIDQAISDHLAEKHERISREWSEWQEFEAWKRQRNRMAAR